VKPLFEYAEYARQLQALVREATHVLSTSADEEVRALAQELPRIQEGEAPVLAPLRIAFVGQYDAGKSTILSALTGRRDIRVSSRVETSEVSEFDWNGSHVVDTPGIHAGYPEHDAKTYAAIHEAELLVFVITNELFDHMMAKHFRSIAFEMGKASELMLVVNKMAQDGGSPETKHADLKRVTAPLTLDALRTVFMDARSYLDALEASDEQDQRELAELSNFSSFVEALNAFVRDAGHLSRLVLPVLHLRQTLDQGARLSSTTDKGERGVLELLHRKRRVLLESQGRLHSTLESAIDVTRAKLVALGEKVADQVEPGVKEESLAEAHRQGQADAAALCDRLVEQCAQAVAKEVERLQAELEALSESELAQQLRGDGLFSTSSAEARFSSDPRVDSPHAYFTHTQRTSTVAQKIGKLAAEAAFGEAAGAMGLGTKTMAKGEKLHQVVLGAGKFFGVQFKPWGAVKVARAIGNVGKVLGVVGGVLGVAAQFAEERQQARYQEQLRQSRDEIRSDYQSAAQGVREQCQAQHAKLFASFYEVELHAIEQESRSILDEQQVKSDEAKIMRELARRCMALLERVRAAGPRSASAA
jgi:hypothetical protein